MSNLRTFVFLEKSDSNSNHYIESENWHSHKLKLSRVRFMADATADQISAYVSCLNEQKFDVYIVCPESREDIALTDIKGAFRVLDQRLDRPFIQSHLAGPVEIYESYLSIFSSDFLSLNWPESSVLYTEIEGFVKSIIEESISELNASDKEDYQPFLKSLNIEAFTMEQDGETFHHPAVPFFKIRPKSELCELPLPTHEFRVKLIDALKQKLPTTVVSNDVERISVLDGLAELARQGSAIVTTWVNAASLNSVRLQLLGMGVVHANAGDQADDVSVSGVFPITATFAEDQRILTLTLMAHNLENSDLSKLSVSAYWDAQHLTCRHLDKGNNTSAVKLEVEMPEYVSSNSFNYACTFNAAEASLRIDIGQEV